MTEPEVTNPKRSLPLLERLSEESIARAVHASAGSILAQGLAARSIAAEVFDLYTSALSQVEARVPPSRPRACSAGCAYCCHLKVGVTAAEALRVGAALRASLDEASLRALTAKVFAVDARTHGLDTEGRVRAKIGCPLLGDGGRCIAYEARPLACAGANSYSQEQCRAGFESTSEDVGIDHYGLQPRSAAAARAGAAAAIMERGLDGRLLELVAALRVVLEDPKAADRWERGEPVFDSAVDHEYASWLRGS